MVQHHIEINSTRGMDAAQKTFAVLRRESSFAERLLRQMLAAANACCVVLVACDSMDDSIHKNKTNTVDVTMADVMFEIEIRMMQFE